MGFLSSLLENKKTLITVCIGVIFIIGVVIAFSVLNTAEKKDIIQSQTTQTKKSSEDNNNTASSLEKFPQAKNNSVNGVVPPAQTSQTQSNDTGVSEFGPVNGYAVHSPQYITDWVYYDNDLYNLQHPQDWKINRAFANGLQTVRMAPKNNPKNEAVPSFTIYESEDSFKPSLEDREKPYVDLGFAKSTTAIANWNATKLSGTIPSGNPLNTLGTSPVEETHIFFERDGYAFRIVYNYVGSVYSFEFEDLFNKIISTMGMD